MSGPNITDKYASVVTKIMDLECNSHSSLLIRHLWPYPFRHKNNIFRVSLFEKYFRNSCTLDLIFYYKTSNLHCKCLQGLLRCP